MMDVHNPKRIRAFIEIFIVASLLLTSSHYNLFYQTQPGTFWLEEGFAGSEADEVFVAVS